MRALWLCLLLSLGCQNFGLAAEPPSPPSYGVRLETAWISMKDGVRLAATLYMPDGAKPGEKFPALLEYLPYRKDDGTAARDYPLHAYFAHRGYASVRVDIRGFGASEGVPTDREYSEQEQKDGLEVIHWLATQAWSNGKVGMFGISWGGFNSLQMAMQNPPELKAIIAIDATENLFHDDVHFMDGLAHVDEFELDMDLSQGFVGAPNYSLDEKVLDSHFNSPPWSLMYLKHQRDGAFWRSPVRPLEQIRVPCFVIGGLLDGYRDSIPRMLEQVKGAPVKALIGPWNHTFPNEAEPGPEIEWRDQAVRWWDYWLKGRDTGVLQDAKLVIYMQHWHPPDPNLPNVPGEWRREDTWPPASVKQVAMYPQPNHTLANSPAPQNETTVHKLKYVPSIGVEAGFWWGELLADQRPVDAFSLVYDSAPLQEEVAIMGRPWARLRAAADAPLANWFARLSDVAPDGTVTQITGAGLSGAQRESANDPKNLEPGKFYPLNVEMHLATWVFPKGHRIRLSISNALWPMVLPTPYPMTTSLALGADTKLDLPVVPVHGVAPPAFREPEPEEERPGYKAEGFPWPGEWTVERDEGRRKTTVHWKGGDTNTYPFGTEKDSEAMTYEVNDANPAVSSVRGEVESEFRLKDRTLTWRGHLSVATDAKNFYYKYTRELLKDGQICRQKTWEETVPRDHQ